MVRKRRLLALVVLGSIIAAIGMGCGGGDNDESTAGGPSASSGADGAGEGNSGGTGQPSEPGGGPPGAGAGAKPSPNGSSDGAADGEPPGGSIEGGSGGGGESTTTQSAKAKFIERADAICSRATSEALEAVGAQVKKRAKKGGPSESEVQAESIHTAFLPVIQAEIEELEALAPPPGDEEQMEAFLDALQEDVDATMDTEYTPTSVGSFGTEEFRDSSALAAEYGLSNCQLS